MVPAWESEFLWCWLSFIAAFVMLFFIHCFSTSSLTFPWAIARFLHPSCTFSPAHRRVICDTFILTFFYPSLLQFYCDGYGFEWAFFYPQAFFTLRYFLTFLTQPPFIKASLGAGSSSSKFSGHHADPRNTDSTHLFVWVTTIHKRGMVVGSIYGLQQAGYVKCFKSFWLQYCHDKY